MDGHAHIKFLVCHQNTLIAGVTWDRLLEVSPSLVLQWGQTAVVHTQIVINLDVLPV